MSDQLDSFDAVPDWRQKLRHLYAGNDQAARRFQWSIASIDVVIISFFILVTCLFLITGFVFTAFAGSGSGMEGYIDALYFTVATVTTTGFGDITLPGTMGKLTSIVAMIVGISLFVRVAQTLFMPFKVFSSVPTLRAAKTRSGSGSLQGPLAYACHP